MNTSLVLKAAITKNLPAIEALLEDNHLPSDIKLQEISLLERDDQIISIGGIENYRPYGLLRSLVVAEPLRGHGLGTKVCHQLIELAHQQGIEELYLLTTTAANFFSKLGFKQIPRDTVPPQIQNTKQFSYLCPFAVCMKKTVM